MRVLLHRGNPMSPTLQAPQPNSTVNIVRLDGGTPTIRMPVLSQNDTNSNCFARGPKSRLSSLIVWLVEDRSWTNFLLEKLTVRTAFKTSAKSAPR